MSSQREPPTLNVAPLAGTSDVSALRLTLRALEPLLANPDVTEICINRPQEAFVETGSGWRRESLPFATFDWCRRLAKLVANSTRQRIDESTPLLSASLPGGERIQIVLPPATTQGCAAITIRRPSEEVWSIADLCKRGIFRMTRRASDSLDATETELMRLLDAKEYESFMRLARIESFWRSRARTRHSTISEM
jgi:type IV secretion system protein VirB11